MHYTKYIESNHTTTQSVANSLANTLQRKGKILEDNRKSSNNISWSQNPIQRTVEAYGDSHYKSTYQRLVEPDNLILYNTKEEAEKVDEEYRQIWEKMRAAPMGGGVGKSAAITTAASAASADTETVTVSTSPSTAKKAPLKDDGKKADPNVININQGLIRGYYIIDQNKADLHVDKKKDDGGGLVVADMLVVAQYLYGEMIKTQQKTGVKGVFSLHPTGAAIVKIMVNLLGEALGANFSKMRARWAKYRRTPITGPKSANKIHANILPEHFHYLESLRGENKVAMTPNFRSNTGNYRLEQKDFVLGANNQYAMRNMLDGTKEGNELFEKYKASELDPKEDTSAGLDITIYADQLPAIITLLTSQSSAKKK